MPDGGLTALFTTLFGTTGAAAAAETGISTAVGGVALGGAAGGTVGTAGLLGGVTAAGVSAATTVGSVGYSAVQQKKAMAAESRRYEAQQRISKIREARERTRDVRLARIQRAKNIQAGQVSGSEGSGTSGLQGTLASAGTQQAANLAFRNQVGGLQSQVAQEDMNIFDARGRQQVAGAIGKVSGTIFDIYGGAQQMGKNMATA